MKNPIKSRKSNSQEHNNRPRSIFLTNLVALCGIVCSEHRTQAYMEKNTSIFTIIDHKRYNRQNLLERKILKKNILKVSLGIKKDYNMHLIMFLKNVIVNIFITTLTFGRSMLPFGNINKKKQ